MTRPVALTGLVAMALSAAHAPPVSAQAVCSAPHSSPVLAQGGTIETLRPGTGWAQVSGFRQVSNGFFGPTGDRQPFLADGRVRTHSAFFTAAVGVVRGVDVWGQLPVHDLRYSDQTGGRHRLGLGDPRFSVRLSPRVVGIDGLPLAVRAGVKLPGSRFPVDATVIPLSEGQRDWELSLESGAALGPGDAPLYVLGWVGVRWRETNEQTDRKPGDELFGHAAVGGAWRAFRLELGAEALLGRAPRQLGLELPAGRRRLLQLQPTVGYHVGRSTVEVTLLLPLAGRNLPTGTAGSVGYRFSWGAL